MVGTVADRWTAWIDRNLNGYTAGLGTAVGLIVGAYVAFWAAGRSYLAPDSYHVLGGGCRRAGRGGDRDSIYARPGQADAAVASRDASGYAPRTV